MAATARPRAIGSEARSRCCKAGWRRCGSGRRRLSRPASERVTRSASPSMISRRPGQCAAISSSAPSARASRSTAITFARPFREQRAGEAARTGADFDHGDAGERPCRAGDLPGQVEVEQEVLAERLARLKPVRRDHFAQARQAVRGQRLRRPEARRRGLEGLSRTRRAGRTSGPSVETRRFAPLLGMREAVRLLIASIGRRA